jgi:Uma2 family endonuclease
MEQRAHSITEEEYLILERASEIKHEFFAGEVFAMAGGTFEHGVIGANLISTLRIALKGKGCVVGSADVRIKIEATGLSTYPDLSVVCGAPEFEADRRDTLLNPILVAEVLSRSSEAYDRGRKFHHYRKIPSLQAYLLVSQDSPTIEQLIRQSDFRWEYRVATGMEAEMDVPSLGVSLKLAEVFEAIQFPPLVLHPQQPSI